ncbi:Chaperone DnaJ-domain superfamily protein isoform 1 [Hibiscus syriacus]|uniref:Chaperone DnaJ-domain superfamily protein isoform 1 n=1 Tax=Hibiscus syriacus TaxID=106335 RepID=A0A6A2ZDD7_HIBSY|nr:calcium-dependent mitochondrial ATP-magnesium/phosphate carrier protein 1-like isoform X2 [Hibiscus syriacus]KAE8689586.1 Chaperone DnaJ-domain superfamily protein isoform 1 [Hibiscus syriacus]
MMSKSDPVGSSLHWIRFIKEAISPLALGIRKAAKDLERCWVVSNDKTNKFELIVPLNGSGSDRNGKVQIFGGKSRIDVNNHLSRVDREERTKGLSIKVPINVFVGMFSPENESNNVKVEAVRKGLRGKDVDRVEETCMNWLLFAVTWSTMVNRFAQAIPSSFKSGRKLIREMDDNKWCLSLCTHNMESEVPFEVKCRESKARVVMKNESLEHNNDRENVSFECFIGNAFDHMTQKINHLKAITSIWEGRKIDVNGFLGNLNFARVGGVRSGVVGVSSSMNKEGNDGDRKDDTEGTGGNSSQKLADQILSNPLSNIERLSSTLPTVSVTDLTEPLPPLGRSLQDHPNKKILFSVQEFFRYTESEGRRFFTELDRDGDGKVTLEDLEVALRNRNLPQRYSREFMRRTRRNPFSKSFGWKQFLSLMERKEPTILRAYTNLCLSESGTLQKSEVLASLKTAGLPATEDNAVALMRFLNVGSEESVSYGHFRRFMLLLPSERLLRDDPRNIWFEAATVAAAAPSAEIPAESVLKSALAGGLSCAFSAAVMHPVDTVKTQVQASTTLTFPEIMSKIPQIGLRGLYKGSIPAILGQFSSHGLRTGICEVSKVVLINVSPNLPDIQVDSMASFFGTVLGTVARLPCEVLKQRLQAGLYDNVGEALIGTWQQDGLKGFFRGTGATLCRELPFYVAGMGLYTESKKLVQRLIRRDLEPWEVVVVGAISGGLASVTTTPFDVIKTRMMIASGGRSTSMSAVAVSILRHEGPLALFKGAVPRFFWVAPLGAMNFAGYELLRKAMDGNKDVSTDPVSEKKLTNSGLDPSSKI